MNDNVNLVSPIFRKPARLRQTGPEFSVCMNFWPSRRIAIKNTKKVAYL
jgi:hypothetical protein